MRRAFGVGLAIVLTAAVAPSATIPAALPSGPPPRVVVIGDSVLTAVLWNEEARTILGRGLDLELDVGICRRLIGPSCSFDGAAVPSLVEVVNARGQALGQVVIVEAGYNDEPPGFAESVEAAITTLLRAGVRQILWPDLREWQPQYIGMNQDLRAVARRHPEVTIVGWNAYSRDHYSWFQGDGVHLVHGGAIAMATFLNASVTGLLHPPRIIAPTVLPRGRVGRWYSTRLRAEGGIPPYRWQLASGPLPQGLRLSTSGLITGTPRRGAEVRLTFRAADAFGNTTSALTELVVDPGATPRIPSRSRAVRRPG